MTDSSLFIDTPPQETASAANAAAYRVLARKYRPTTFAEVVGQDALVRTLTNAIRSGRLAHAFMLTGVRGVGKTTTARIIARALNCVGSGVDGPTTEPCGICDSCRSIGQDRHVDVMEMDAASRTGVDDIREIIDGVRYGPVSGRYKVYIIDEVHMLSKNAFNALLKTLEEPPPHVKFIFATTEIRKVPVTVLSRCQRFDLRRVDADTLVKHFGRVARDEGIEVEPDALALIARAADGSVRDGMSLLDQAIALSGSPVTVQQVRDMLGLADRALIVDLFEAAMSARPKDALDILTDLHRSGADPVVILQDLLDVTHGLTRLKLVPGLANDPATPEIERARGAALAAKLSIPVLTRAWQVLLKGLGELQSAPLPMQAAEMVVVRLAFAADMPTPGDLIKKLQDGGSVSAGSGAPVGGGSGGGAPRAMLRVAAEGGGRAASVAVAQPLPQAETARAVDPAAELVPLPKTYRELVQLFAEKREGALYGLLYGAVHLVRFEAGKLEIRPSEAAPPNLAGRVGKCLTEWTGRHWMVTISRQPGDPLLAEQDRAAEAKVKEDAANHPLVRAVLEAFPGATIANVRQLGVEAEPEASAEDELPDMLPDGTAIPDPYDDEGEF